jgi:membrane-associated phospholipid phosphatase
MTAPELQRAAEFLATHAVLLLGLGILVALGALALVAGAVRLIARAEPGLREVFTFIARHARAISAVDRIVSVTGPRIPSGYVVLHLLLGLVLIASAGVFIVIAEDVLAGGLIATFDGALAQALHDRTTRGWHQFFAAASWLGQRETLAVATIVLAAGVLHRYGVVVAAVWIAAQGGGGLLNLALKEAFERTRPAFADPQLAASSWSFPSGHAMGTFILCGVGCYLLLRDARSWVTASLVITIALSWCLVIGFSRLYLGAHFVSDVIAGAIAGSGWVAVCVSAFEAIRRHGNRPPHRNS